MDPFEPCDCEARGVPEGLCCFKPGCERTVRAEAALENTVRELIKNGWGEQ